MATFSERLIADLCSPDENTRRYAAEDLGDSDDAGAVGPLVGALSDSSPAVREAAMDSLTRIGGEPVVRAVLPALGSEHVPLRNAACFLLGELGETAVGPLAELLDDRNKDVRLFAIDTLARIGSRSAETAIVRALEDAEVNVAAAAAGALGQIGAASSVEPLIAALKADSWVRCAAAKSLGRIGGLQALRTLMGLACDEDPLVSFAAAQALTEAGERRSAPLATQEEK
jgi:HEAT repeat protein